MTSIFVSYSHKDEQFREELEVHLAMLKREGSIDVWHDRRIVAGSEINSTIDVELERSEVILLLISPDFLASSYCFDVEVQRAMQLRSEGNCEVIPVILRPCDWQSANAPFSKLLAVPRDGIPVSKWPDKDDAFLDIVKQLRKALEALSVKTNSKPSRRVNSTDISLPSNAPHIDLPRSSNLRLAKKFTDVDKDRFLDEAMKYFQRFFEQSLFELKERNEGIDTRFIPISNNAFGCVIYRDGKSVAKCGIRLNTGKYFSKGISYTNDESAPENTMQESLSVNYDDQSLFLEPMGMGMVYGGAQRKTKLSFNGASEYLWSLLISSLQRS
ncbi:toll/interleukin-1 receptor domain-containing protein [Pantoea agglomerans]|uniref:toll/interleukin-1 receptor domain-containing protein n=1 Tax=Enterobacter agglomerans TaxID=549 RepID=UPI003C7B1A7C